MESSLRYIESERIPTRLCSNEEWIIFGRSNPSLGQTCNLIEIWSILENEEIYDQSFSKENSVVIECPFQRSITAMTIGSSKFGSSLAIATKDDLVMIPRLSFDLLKKFKTQGVSFRDFKIIEEGMGNIYHIAFDKETNSLLSVCVENQVVVFELQSFKPIVKLDGHKAIVTATEFLAYSSHQLISISQDRTYMIWDLGDSTLLFHSEIVSSSPFLSIAIDNFHTNRFYLGSEDGILRIYEMTKKNTFFCRCLQAIDVRSFVLKNLKQVELEAQISKQQIQEGPTLISAEPTWKSPMLANFNKRNSIGSTAQNDEQFEELKSEIAKQFPIISLYFYSRSSPLKEDSIVDNISLQYPPVLYLATPWGIFSLFPLSLQLGITNIWFKEIPVHFQTIFSIKNPTIPFSSFVGTFMIHFFISSEKKEEKKNHNSSLQLFCCLAAPFKPLIALIPLENPYFLENSSSKQRSLQSRIGKNNLLFEEKEEMISISIFGSENLPLDSPLLSSPLIKTDSDSKEKSLLKPKKGVIMDKPILFRNKIKSSGYGNQMSDRFKGGKLSKISNNNNNSKQIKIEKKEEKNYPLNTEEPKGILLTNEKLISGKLHNSGITKLCFHPKGNKLFSSSHDKTSRMIFLPLSQYQGDGVNFIGHNSSVQNISCNLDGKFCITSSNDNCARIWSSKKTQESLLIISKLENNFKQNNNNKSSFNNNNNNNLPIVAPIKKACFYYQDKFISICEQNRIHLYKYYIETEEEKSKISDLKKSENNHRYKKVFSFVHQKSQQITTFANSNYFLSNLLISCGSNKEIEIYDFCHEKVVCNYVESHSKNIHSICLNGGNSQFSNLALEVFELFATSSFDGTIKLWDLRTSQCVKVFQGHQNKSHVLGLDISPCSKFIATGSEDKSAFIYDMRSSSMLTKIIGHTDVVSDVLFHPLKQKSIVTASYDGNIKFYQ